MRIPNAKCLLAFVRYPVATLMMVMGLSAHANTSAMTIERACAIPGASGGAHANHRLTQQIRNFRFAYDLQNSMRDQHGFPVDLHALARARGNLIEVCRLRQAGSNVFAGTPSP